MNRPQLDRHLYLVASDEVVKIGVTNLGRTVEERLQDHRALFPRLEILHAVRALQRDEDRIHKAGGALKRARLGHSGGEWYSRHKLEKEWGDDPVGWFESLIHGLRPSDVLLEGLSPPPVERLD